LVTAPVSYLLFPVRSSVKVSPAERPLRKAKGRIVHSCWEIAKYPTKDLQVTQGLAPGIGGGAIG
jgi:hypothetical protein